MEKNPGSLVLQGGSEFQGNMIEADRAILAGFNLDTVVLTVLTTAAAVDNNHVRAGENGRRWFESLGVRTVNLLHVVDKADSNNPENVHVLLHSDILFLLGGSPVYLHTVIEKSLLSRALLQARERGTTICGSSAGAMVLCEYFFDPDTHVLRKGLGLLAGYVLIPHHAQFHTKWRGSICEQNKGLKVIGIDEETAMEQKSNGHWLVHGGGLVTCYLDNGVKSVFKRGESFFTK